MARDYIERQVTVDASKGEQVKRTGRNDNVRAIEAPTTSSPAPHGSLPAVTAAIGWNIV
jgi:hypothetical protein